MRDYILRIVIDTHIMFILSSFFFFFFNFYMSCVLNSTSSPLDDLQPRPYCLAALPEFSRLERLPTAHGARLHADHLLVLLVPKVAHPLGFLRPRVPQRDGVQSLAGDRQQGAVVVGRGHDDGHGRVHVLVDAVRLLRDGDRGRGFRLDGVVVGLVRVGLVLEILDANLGDILASSSVSQ